jgi:hypothetical protein
VKVSEKEKKKKTNVEKPLSGAKDNDELEATDCEERD